MTEMAVDGLLLVCTNGVFVGAYCFVVVGVVLQIRYRKKNPKFKRKTNATFFLGEKHKTEKKTLSKKVI